MSDPYSRLAQGFLAQQSTGLTLRLGQVAGLSPLALTVAGLTLTEGIFVNPDLLEQQRSGRVQLPASQIDETGASLTLDGTLQQGDRVVLLSDDDQIFYILCRIAGGE